jgi:Ca2+-binding EF-hand superfamily protein
MKRLSISLLVVGLCAGTATAALAQNVTAGDKPGEASQGMTTDQNQKEMTNPSKAVDVTSPGKSKHDKGAAAFKKADKDSDGTLDKEEAKAMPRVAKNFDAIDTDKDGTVSLDEVHTFMKARHEAANN